MLSAGVTARLGSDNCDVSKKRRYCQIVYVALPAGIIEIKEGQRMSDGSPSNLSDRVSAIVKAGNLRP